MVRMRGERGPRRLLNEVPAARFEEFRGGLGNLGEANDVALNPGDEVERVGKQIDQFV